MAWFRGQLSRSHSTETTVSRTFQTDATGTYLAPALNIGTYTIEVSVTGFKAFRRTDIVLNVRDQIRVDVRLEIGNVAETIEVTGQAVSLQTETASVEQVVSASQLQGISMNGRNFLQLAALVPGAASTQPAYNTPVGLSANAGINFNGLRSSQNVWRVDGQENYDRGCVLAIKPFHLSVNSLEENLRKGDPPVVARISKDEVILDMITVFDEEIPLLAHGVEKALR